MIAVLVHLVILLPLRIVATLKNALASIELHGSLLLPAPMWEIHHIFFVPWWWLKIICSANEWFTNICWFICLILQSGSGGVLISYLAIFLPLGSNGQIYGKATSRFDDTCTQLTPSFSKRPHILPHWWSLNIYIWVLLGTLPSTSKSFVSSHKLWLSFLSG